MGYAPGQEATLTATFEGIVTDRGEDTIVIASPAGVQWEVPIRLGNGVTALHAGTMPYPDECHHDETPVCELHHVPQEKIDYLMGMADYNHRAYRHFQPTVAMCDEPMCRAIKDVAGLL